MNALNMNLLKASRHHNPNMYISSSYSVIESIGIFSVKNFFYEFKFVFNIYFNIALEKNEILVAYSKIIPRKILKHRLSIVTF